MTATQLLEKLGADSTFNKADLSPQDLDTLIKLHEKEDDEEEFDPPLLHANPDDDDCDKN